MQLKKYKYISEKNLNEKSSISNKSSKNSHLNEEINNGKWTPEEHLIFLKACIKHEDNWVKIKEEIKTRSFTQIRSHAHKYLITISSQFNKENVFMF